MSKSSLRKTLLLLFLMCLATGFACKDEKKGAENAPFEAGAGQCVVTLQVSGMS